jgi:molybdopterin-guanine dinucleotide biosynthesis protein A
MPIAREEITGLLLAGGQGLRMGGVDKGLQLLHGRSLVSRVLERLSPQVGVSMISANRHLEDYRALGWPVHRDASPEACGPLAGFLAGLQHAATPCLLTVPCDTPHLPLDLAARLAQALDADPQADIAMAATAGTAASPSPNRRQPAFCLMRTGQGRLRDSLSRFLQSGQRKIGAWAAQHRCVTVDFDDEAAFLNVNTAQDLARLQ